MKIEKNKMLIIKNKKILGSIFIVIALVFSGALVDFLGVHEANAARGGAGNRVSRPVAQPSSSGRSSSYSAPKKVNGQIVTFSKSGCNNFNIDGQHYGGSQSCSILNRNCGGGNPSGGGGSPNGNGGGGDSSGGGGGGCPSGQYYCEVIRSCTNNNLPCNRINPGYIPADGQALNDSIPGKFGPVKLKGIKAKPALGNSGYSCKVDFSSAFDSYDHNTVCTFTSSNGYSSQFKPENTDTPLNYSETIKKDTSLKMRCVQDDDPNYKAEVSETTCRLNWGFEEIN